MKRLLLCWLLNRHDSGDTYDFTTSWGDEISIDFCSRCGRVL